MVAASSVLVIFQRGQQSCYKEAPYPTAWPALLLMDPLTALRVLRELLLESLLFPGALQSLSVSEFMQKTSAAGELSSTPLWTLPEVSPPRRGGSDALIP